MLGRGWQVEAVEERGEAETSAWWRRNATLQRVDGAIVEAAVWLR